MKTMKENNSIWVVCSEYGVRLYSCEKYAREEYQREVSYYKNHHPNESDKREYRVWHETDEDGMHYTIVEITFGGAKRNITVYYTERIIIK